MSPITYNMSHINISHIYTYTHTCIFQAITELRDICNDLKEASCHEF